MRNCKCGNQVANNAKFCPKCGHRYTSTLVKVLAVLIISPVVFIVLMAMLVPSSSSGGPSSAPASPVVNSSVPSTGNIAHDRLVALPPAEQAVMLGHVVGEGCVGKRAFYMGGHPNESQFWSVACTNGKSFSVQINADAQGSTNVLDCGMLKLVAHESCFVKFKD